MDALTKWTATAETKAKLRLTFKQLALLGLTCTFLGASGYGYYWWTFDRFFQETDDAYVGGMSPRSRRILPDSLRRYRLPTTS